MNYTHHLVIRFLSVALALCLICLMPIPAFAAQETAMFDDVASTDYYFNPISWAAEQGIAAGTGGNKFFPNLACTRAQVVTFLWRAKGREAVDPWVMTFADVEASSVYYDAIAWAVASGVTSGTGNGNFSPNQTCTRAQVVTFLWRAMGQPQPESTYNPFADVNVHDYFYIPVLWAVENGITAGMSATTFGPYEPCTRGQVVTFLYRTMNGD